MFFSAPQNFGLLNPAELAYLGDAVFELLVRERLIADGVRRGSVLHRRAAQVCSSHGQARAARVLMPMLTETELSIFKKGRNAALSIAKKRSPTVHCTATGLEALFGDLYLRGEHSRLLELFEICFSLQKDPE